MYVVVVLAVMADTSDTEKFGDELQHGAAAAVTVTTDEKFAVANALLQQVDDNIVKTAMLRKQMPSKCRQLLARRCRFQLMSAVSIYHSCSSCI